MPCTGCAKCGLYVCCLCDECSYLKTILLATIRYSLLFFSFLDIRSSISQKSDVLHSLRCVDAQRTESPKSGRGSRVPMYPRPAPIPRRVYGNLKNSEQHKNCALQKATIAIMEKGKKRTRRAASPEFQNAKRKCSLWFFLVQFILARENQSSFHSLEGGRIERESVFFSLHCTKRLLVKSPLK